MKSWYRSVDDRMLGGVCGGIAEGLGIDVLLVRLFFVAATAVSGLGIVLYFVLWITTPAKDMAEEATKEEISRQATSEIKQRANEVGQGIQKAVESDDPAVRMVARWALAILIALGANKLRAKRQHAAPAKVGSRPGSAPRPKGTNCGDSAEGESSEPAVKVEVEVQAEKAAPEPDAEVGE